MAKHKKKMCEITLELCLSLIFFVAALHNIGCKEHDNDEDDDLYIFHNHQVLTDIDTL